LGGTFDFDSEIRDDAPKHGELSFFLTERENIHGIVVREKG
jgi:hypothetical protein